MADERWLIAGLGNPGTEYAGNRHNAGYMVADLLAGRMGARFKRDRSGAAVATGRLAGLGTITASGSASADRPAGWTRPTSCCAISLLPSASSYRA